MKRIVFALVFIFCLNNPLFSKAIECDEYITIDSVKYSVGMWCGMKIDSTLLANPEKLVRLPEKNCYNGYKIYVDSATRVAFIEMAEVL